MTIGRVIGAIVAVFIIIGVLIGLSVSRGGTVPGSSGPNPVQPPVVQAPTPAPAAPAATAIPSAPRVAVAPTPNAAGQCHAFFDYGLKFKPEVATSGTAIRVEWWVPAVSNEEFETFMMAKEAKGGRFLVSTNPELDGHAWEFVGNCTETYMKDHIEKDVIPLRLAGGANNKGYREWKSTNLFKAAVPPD